MGTKLDLSGSTFGRLTALRLAESWQGTNARWICQCECGQEIEVSTSRLRSGKTRSCGCLRREIITKPRKKSKLNNLTTPRPLGLSDIQLEIILDKSHVIDPAWRSRFLAGVVDLLLPTEVVTDGMVENACRSVSDRMVAKGRRGSDEDDRLLEERLA